MRIARYESAGRSGWAVVDLQSSTLRPFRGEFETWSPALTQTPSEATLEFSDERLALSTVRLLPPLGEHGQVFVAGANYLRHLKEFKLDVPPAPVVFLKSSRALIGAHDPIRYPKLTNELDYEVELVAVIGASIESGADPLDSVLGYTVGNDVSARDLQRGGIGMDLFSAKSLDGTTGVGPWIVTRDEFERRPTFQLKLRVNDEERQNGSTGDMRWSVGELLQFLNQRVAVRAGDIFFTGTPDGVGVATGRYLQRGDLVVAEIPGLGALSNRISA